TAEDPQPARCVMKLPPTLLLSALLLMPAALQAPFARAVERPGPTPVDVDLVGSSSVPDGAGGAITVWCEPRPGRGIRVLAQHLLVSGKADPDWPVDGLAISGAAGDQLAPILVSDHRGGILVAWQARRGERSKIYVQHVLRSGRLDPGWPVNGSPVCTAR